MDDGLVSNFIYNLFVDNNDNIWLAMYGGLNIIMFSDKDCREIDKIQMPPLNTDFVTAVSQVNENTFLVGTNGDGLFKITENSLSREYNVEKCFDNEELSGISSWDILLRRNGEILVATDERGILCIRDFKTTLIFNTDNGLLSNQVLDLIEDNEGNFWYTTLGQGISMYDDNKFIRYGRFGGIRGREINDILAAGEDIYIASDEAVYRMKVEGDKIDPVDLTGTGREVEGISPTSLLLHNSQLWIGTQMGLKVFGDNLIRDFRLNNELSSSRINCMHKDSEGNIWIGTDNGYNKIVNDTVYTFNEEQGFVNNEVQTIIEDSKGRIWMGTLGGLVMLDKQVYTDYNEEDGLSELRIHSLAEDEYGDIWIGTFGGGLFRFGNSGEEKQISRVANNDKLSSANIYSLLFVSKNVLISGTDIGFDVLELDANRAILSSTHYNMYDGFSEGENNLNSIAMDESGIIWFGTSDGLVRYDPFDDSDNYLKPEIVLTDIHLFFETVDWGAKGFKCRKCFNIPEELVLRHNENHLTFDFTGFCYHDPGDLSYSYFLEGQSRTWSPYDISSEVTFSGLTPGTYKYMVKAKNEYGTESDLIEFDFIIKPPFWQTTWFILLTVSMAVVILLVIIRLRERALIKEKLKLENIVQERTLEIVQQKDEITNQRDILATQKQEITDSIEYAERIQLAILPDNRILEEAFRDFFILFKPKDIVSGDFYWMTRKNDYIIFTACDCTGHGVPGAFMSLLGVSFLNKIVNESGETEPARILELLRENVVDSLKQGKFDNSSKDGMDIALCTVDKDRKKLLFAGANNPVYIIRKNGKSHNLMEIKADRMPVGYHPEMKQFTQHEFELQSGDSIYMLSDGFVDQFGGQHGKKFMAKRFKSLLLENQGKSMKEQLAILETTLYSWMNFGKQDDKNCEQIDDIIVMGVKI